MITISSPRNDAFDSSSLRCTVSRRTCAATADQRMFAIVGDGELNEGPIWGGMLFASHNRLSNLTMIVDANGIQTMDRTDEVIWLGSIRRKQIFGFETADVDGHDHVTGGRRR